MGNGGFLRIKSTVVDSWICIFGGFLLRISAVVFTLRIQLCPKKGIKPYKSYYILEMGLGPSNLRESGGVWILRVIPSFST